MATALHTDESLRGVDWTATLPTLPRHKRKQIAQIINDTTARIDPNRDNVIALMKDLQGLGKQMEAVGKIVNAILANEEKPRMTAQRERTMASVSVLKRIPPAVDAAGGREKAREIVQAFLTDANEPIDQRFALAMDLLTSLPPSSQGGDASSDGTRFTCNEVVVAFLDPEKAAADAAWRKAAES